MKPVRNKANSKTKRTAVSGAKTSSGLSANSKYKNGFTGTKKTTKSNGKSIVPPNLKQTESKAKKQVFSKVRNYSEKSNDDEISARAMEPKFSEQSEEDSVAHEFPMKAKLKHKKKDAKQFLIDMISDVIKNKGEFRPEDLNPDQLKAFKDTQKLVSEMKRLGIDPPRVNILDEKSDVSEESDQKQKPVEKFDRKDRYGIFERKMWDKVVDLYYDDPNYMPPHSKKTFHIEPYDERVFNSDEPILDFNNITDDYYRNRLDDLKVEEYEAPYTEEHLKYENKMNAALPQRKKVYSIEAGSGLSNVPGIPNSQKRVEEVKRLQIERRFKAVIRIQKMYRGFKARQNFKKLVQKRNYQDAEDYGYFEITGMSVKNYLDQRRHKAEDEKFKQQAINDLSPGQNIENDRFLMHDLRQDNDELNILNIYFNKMKGRNPFETPNQSHMTLADTPTKSKSGHRKHSSHRHHKLHDSQNSSIRESINYDHSASKMSHDKSRTKHTTHEDDEYSEDFEDDSIRESIRESISGSLKDKKPKHHDHKKSHQVTQSLDEISESIYGDKAQKSYRSIRESIDEEIPEESMVYKNSYEGSAAFIVRGRKNKSPNLHHSDSIKEEISGSGKVTPRIKESIHEEIEGSNDYSQNFDSYSHSKDKLSGSLDKKKEEFNKSPKRHYVVESREDIELRKKLEKRYGLNKPDKVEDLVNDLLNAKHIYEQSATTMHCVDKFERILAMNHAQSEIVTEKLRHIESERKMQAEINKIREQQIADLVALLLSNKSDFDSKQIGQIISNHPMSKDLQDEVDKRVSKFKAQQDTKNIALKRTRFEDDEYSDDFVRMDDTRKSLDSSVPKSKAMSMFDKVPIQRSKLITPKHKKPDHENKFSQKRKTLESSESIPYSEDFENESAALSRSRATFVKTGKDEIDEDIHEDVNEIKDTITERIEDNYSENFEEISESIIQSKKFSQKSKPKDHKDRLNSKYSASKIDEEEESIQEMIEESMPVRFRHQDDNNDQSSSYIGTRPKRSDNKLHTKPDVGMKKSKSKEKFPQNKLIEKLQDHNVNDFIRTVEKGIEANFREELDKLVNEYSDSLIDDYEYARKKKVLEDWKDKEMQDIKKKKMLIEGWMQMSEIVAKIKTDEDHSIGHSSGSIKDLKKAPKYLRLTKPDYDKNNKSDESEFNDDDHSDDSFGIRRAKKQIRDIKAHENVNDSADEDILDEADLKMRKKNTKKKRLAAKYLLEEKERAIQEGLRQKMVELDEKHAQTLLDEALKVDVKREIEKRYSMMLEFDEEQKQIRKKNEHDRQKILEDSIEDSSAIFQKSKFSAKDSIEMSKGTNIEQNAKSIEQNNNIGRNQSKVVKQIKSKEDTIQEDTIQESIEDYSNEFNSISQSQTTLKIDPKKVDDIKPVQPEIKEESNHEPSEIPSEIDEEYSENFDESNDASASLNSNIKLASRNKNLNNNKAQKLSDEIMEAANEEDHEESASKSKDKVPEFAKSNLKDLPPLKSKELQNDIMQNNPDSKSESLIDETPVDSEGSHDSLVHRIPTGKSDDFMAKIGESVSSNDLEVIEGSHQSVDWLIDIPVVKPEEKKLNTINEESKDSKDEDKIQEDIDEDYSVDDFDDFGDSNESNKDRSNTPRISDRSDDIMNDKEKVADLIAEELFGMIDDIGLFNKMRSKIIPEREVNLEDYKDKFPFVKPYDPNSDRKMQIKNQVSFFNRLADEIMQERN